MAVAEIFEEHKHILFNDVISLETAELMTSYLFLKKDAGLLVPPMVDKQVPNTWVVYGDPLFDTLLAGLVPTLSKALGKNLVPSYTYARIYQNGSELTRHVDRSSCELSATLTLGKDDESDDWPIYIDHKGKETPINVPVGSMLFYKGCEVEHWRKPYHGKWQCQVFLHYVDGDGPYAESGKYDGRKALGLDKKEETQDVLPTYTVI